jgi:sugar phosphate isomerase/epimerase
MGWQLMEAHVDGMMMCFSNVAHLPFPERLRAARLAGCDQLSIMPVEVEEVIASGISIAEMRTMAADHGVAITRLDPLVRWTRIWRPINMSEPYIRRIDYVPEAFFGIAEQLGCTYASLNATFPLGAMPMDELIESYAAICRLAADYGMSCDLEFIPLWGVRDLDTAWRIVSGANATNGGIVFDSWHYVRGHSSLELLRRIPGRWIHSVQLNDGPLHLPKGRTLEEDCYQRLFPGEGEFPLTQILQALSQTGGLRQLGAEVFSPVLASLSAEEVAKRSAESVETSLARAGLSSHKPRRQTH